MIPETMNEVVFYGLGDMRLVQSPVPDISSDDVLVRIQRCAVCPTDVRKYYFENYKPLKVPTNLGHEWSGDIARVGENVKHLKPGMRVAGEGFIGYAEFGRVEKSLFEYLLPLPQEVTYDEGTFLEPMADCLHALIDIGDVRLGDVVVIIGAGPMGLQCVGLAKIMGAKVIVSEPIPERRSLAAEFGADFTIDPFQAPLADQIMDVNQGNLARISIVSVASPEAINSGIMSVGQRGRVVLFGGGPKGTQVQIDPNWVHYNEISIIGSEWIGLEPWHKPSHFPLAMEIIASKRVPVAHLVTDRFPLEQIAAAIETAAMKTTLKVIVEP